MDIGREEDWKAAEPVGIWDVTVGGDLVDCGDEAARQEDTLAFRNLVY